MTTYHESGLTCPACFQDLSLAFVEADDQSRGPLDGDQTVCSHCTAFLRYKEVWDEEHGCSRASLVVIARDDYEALPEKHRAELMTVRNKLIAIRAQGREEEDAILGAIVREIAWIKQALLYTSCVCPYCRSGEGPSCIRDRA